METTLTTVHRVHDLDDLLSSVGLAAFADGVQPVARWFEVTRTAPITDEAVAVDDGRATRWVQWGRLRGVLVEGDGWMATVRRREADDEDDATTAVWVTAVDHDRLDHVCGLLRKSLGGGADRDPGTVSVRSWTMRGGWVDRVIDAPRWADVRRNYADAVRPVLERLVGLRPETLPSGRLLLLHGVPGTGKSTFIRALAREWRTWCGVEVLADPGPTLASADVVDSLLFTRATGDDGTELPWKVLVVEDAHELISAAVGGASDALTRLLHATDGVVGGQAKVLFLLTTNQRLTAVHPALLRPGRCLAEVEIPPLPAPEARAWLGPDAGTVAGPMTLADLYAHGRADDVIRHRADAPAPGQYL